MNVPTWLWFATIGGLIAIIVADLLLVDHKPHAVGIREATRWVLFYVALAVIFGLGLWFFAGGRYAGEFFAGYITEYSLSVDNLFIFVIIMAHVRGAAEAPAPRAAGRHRDRAGHAGHLHRHRRGRHRARSAGSSTSSR